MKMKKNILKITAAIIFAFAISSCDNATDIPAQDEILDDNVFNNVEDLERGLYGVYSGISGSNLIGFTSRFVDDLKIGPGNRGQGIQVFTWSINNGTDEPENIWNNYYNLINRANRLIEASESIEGINEDEQI